MVSSFANSTVRLQDSSNRQNSIETDDPSITYWWGYSQNSLIDHAELIYNEAINKGIAKEVARKVLPEGFTMSRMYMNGTLRSWLHYIDIRCDKSTQKEHREVADKCKDIIFKEFPSIKEALNAT